VSIVKTAGLCFNCLAHHQCTSHGHCKRCNQKHHTSLCPSKPPQPSSHSVQPPTGTQPLPSTMPSNTQTPNPPINKYQYLLAKHLLSNHSACLLMTTIATVSAGPISTECISLASFGNSSRSLQVATITVHTRDQSIIGSTSTCSSAAKFC